MASAVGGEMMDSFSSLGDAIHDNANDTGELYTDWRLQQRGLRLEEAKFGLDKKLKLEALRKAIMEDQWLTDFRMALAKGSKNG